MKKYNKTENRVICTENKLVVSRKKTVGGGEEKKELVRKIGRYQLPAVKQNK